MPRRSAPADFWKYVARLSENGCWEWLSGRDDHGYGRVRYQRREWKTHRLAWLLTYGEEPPANICHSCDNPPCCNPSHLFSGTQKDNMADCARKGRHPRNRAGYLPTGNQHHARTRPEVMACGERNGSAVLTEDNVREIRRLYAGQGWTLQSLAERFGVVKGTINFIVRRKTWRHVT